jgi:hypothetical protein
VRWHFDVNNWSRRRLFVRTINLHFFSDEDIESSASKIDEGVGESSETYDEYRV